MRSEGALTEDSRHRASGSRSDAQDLLGVEIGLDDALLRDVRREDARASGQRRQVRDDGVGAVHEARHRQRCDPDDQLRAGWRQRVAAFAHPSTLLFFLP